MEPTTVALLTELAATAGGLFYLARKWVLARVSPQQVSTALDLARVAVRAADRIAQGVAKHQVDGVAPLTGSAKYQLAAEYLVNAVRPLGLSLSGQEVTGYIHAALAEMESLDAVEVDLPEQQ